MAVGIAVIEMAHKEKLSVFDAHQFHLLPCNLRHHLVCQLVFVLWQKTQGDMTYRLWDSGIHLSLELKTVDDALRSSQQYAIWGKDFFASSLPVT